MKTINEKDRENLAQVAMDAIYDEGRQEGRQEGTEFIASNLLKDGFNIDKIVQLTGLSKERVQELALMRAIFGKPGHRRFK